MKPRRGHSSELIRNLSFEQIMENLSRRQAAVYNMVKEFGPVTCEETAELMGVGMNCISGRFTELNELELIEHVGDARNKADTRDCCLWLVKKWEPNMQLRMSL